MFTFQRISSPIERAAASRMTSSATLPASVKSAGLEPSGIRSSEKAIDGTPRRVPSNAAATVPE